MTWNSCSPILTSCAPCRWILDDSLDRDAAAAVVGNLPDAELGKSLSKLRVSGGKPLVLVVLPGDPIPSTGLDVWVQKRELPSEAPGDLASTVNNWPTPGLTPEWPPMRFPGLVNNSSFQDFILAMAEFAGYGTRMHIVCGAHNSLTLTRICLRARQTQAMQLWRSTTTANMNGLF